MTGRRPRVVVVDDHRLLAQSLAISLRQEGLDCSVATLGAPDELVSSVVGERPDVVLLDLDLGPLAGDGVALVAPILTGTVLSLPSRQSATWLAVFMLALPFMAVTRALVYNRIGDGRYAWAMRAIALLGALLTVAVAVAVPRFGALGAAGATAAAELLTAGVLVAVAGFSRTRKIHEILSDSREFS